MYHDILIEILYELEHRDEIMAKKGFSIEMYYAYMTGRMDPVLKWAIKATEKENKNGSN